MLLFVILNKKIKIAKKSSEDLLKTILRGQKILKIKTIRMVQGINLRKITTV